MLCIFLDFQKKVRYSHMWAVASSWADTLMIFSLFVMVYTLLKFVSKFSCDQTWFFGVFLAGINPWPNFCPIIARYLPIWSVAAPQTNMLMMFTLFVVDYIVLNFSQIIIFIKYDFFVDFLEWINLWPNCFIEMKRCYPFIKFIGVCRKPMSNFDQHR